MKPQTRVVTDGSGDAHHVELGRVFRALLLTGLIGAGAAILGIPVLVYRVAGAEETNRELEAKVAVVERSLREIDTNQRILRQESTWSGTKLDKLLDAADLDRVPRPALPASSIEPPAAASSP